MNTIGDRDPDPRVEDDYVPLPYDELLDELVVETLRSYAELWLSLDTAAQTIGPAVGADCFGAMTQDTALRFAELALRGGIARVTGVWT